MLFLILGAICSTNLFACGNNKCIPPSLVCNGKNDCDDNTDEDATCTGIDAIVILLSNIALF